MNKKIIYAILALILLLLVFLSVACTNPGYDYPKMIDDTREYESVAVTDEQKNIAEYCRIEGYYVSGDYKIVRIVSERGHVDEIELLVLIEGTILKEIKGVEIKETPGYGTKCFEDKFLTQFYERDLLTMEPLTGRQDNYEQGDILYVTGATRTSRALITGVNGVAAFIKSL